MSLCFFVCVVVFLELRGAPHPIAAGNSDVNRAFVIKMNVTREALGVGGDAGMRQGRREGGAREVFGAQ